MRSLTRCLQLPSKGSCTDQSAMLNGEARILRLTYEGIPKLFVVIKIKAYKCSLHCHYLICSLSNSKLPTLRPPWLTPTLENAA